MNEFQAILNSPIVPLIIGALGVLAVGWDSRGKVLAMLKGLVPAAALTTPVVAASGDPDQQAFAAVKLLRDRFTAAGCKEGIAAAQVCLAHLLDHGGDK